MSDGERQREDAEGAAAQCVRVVYCGGCNPHIDRAAVAAEVSGEQADVTLYLSGCPRSCASGHSLTVDEAAAVVVAGANVDGVSTDPGDIAAAVRAKLKE